MQEDSPRKVSTGVRFWTWRVVLVAALAGIIGGVFATRRYELALLTGAGIVLVVASATLPQREKAWFAENFFIGFAAGVAFSATSVGVGLAQAEMPLSRAATVLLPFLAACAVLAVAELLWSQIRHRVVSSDKPSRPADLPGVILGMISGAGVAFLCAGYLGIPLSLV